jgi:sigma-70-like protein
LQGRWPAPNPTQPRANQDRKDRGLCEGTKTCTGGAMPPADRQQELGARPRSLDIADSQDSTPNTALSDDALAELLREQPAAGVAALYDRYSRLVFSLALRIVQDHGAAEEITQDVFLRCWRSIERYQAQQGSLAAWLLAITHHRSIDELRSRRGKDLRRDICCHQPSAT